jgi:hypothetical protein
MPPLTKKTKLFSGTCMFCGKMYEQSIHKKEYCNRYCAMEHEMLKYRRNEQREIGRHSSNSNKIGSKGKNKKD